MRPAWITAHAQLLSVAPVFDDSTAIDMVRSLADRLVDGAGKAEDVLSGLRLSGYSVPERDSWRIADPIRGELLRELQDRHEQVYRDAVAVFLRHATNGLRPVLERALGEQASSLVVDVLRLADPSDRENGFRDVLHDIYVGDRA